jgi:hypothetical protein
MDILSTFSSTNNQEFERLVIDVLGKEQEPIYNYKNRYHKFSGRFLYNHICKCNYPDNLVGLSIKLVHAL